MSGQTNKKAVKCCFTGYRPSKFPFSLDRQSEEYLKFENNLIAELSKLIKRGCLEFYSGMAMGFDIIAAETVLMLKELQPSLDIKLYCVVPFKEQSKTFPQVWKERYDKVLKKSDKILLVSEDYFQGCYQKRNEYLVKNCDYVLTWFDGKPGGTKNTIDYALKKGRYIFNINKSFGSDFAVQTTFELL